MDCVDTRLAILDNELTDILQRLNALGDDEWRRPTALEPVDASLPRWTVLHLAAHLGFGMSMLDNLLATQSSGQPDLDRISFFDQPRSELAPTVYHAAFQVTASGSAAEVRQYCVDNFAAVNRAAATEPTLVGSAMLGTMQLDEFVATRIVEAVVHGLDLTQALGCSPTPSAEAVDVVACILDELHRRKRGGVRPAGLADDWVWVQVASGRRNHDDFGEPLLG